MAQALVCPSCQTRYQVKDDLAGKKFKCRKCSQVLQAPGGAPVARVGNAAETSGRPAPTQAKPATARPARGLQPTSAVDSLLGEELAASPAAGAAPLLAEASVPTGTATAGPIPPAGVPAKKKCPHCGAGVASDVVYCSECGLSIHKKYSGLSRDEDKSDSKLWLYVLAGIGAAMLSTPLFFLLIAMAVGGPIAMLVCVVEINLIVSLGSFALACRIFKQEPPEPSDILRIVGWSVVPANLAVSYLGGTGPLALAAGVGVAIVISSLVCMFHIQMPVVPSILVSICYNIFSGILTVVGVVVLGVIFAGYLVTTTGSVDSQERQGIEEMDPFAVPTRPTVPETPDGTEGPEDDDEVRLGEPWDLSGPRATLVRRCDLRDFDPLAHTTSGGRRACVFGLSRTLTVGDAAGAARISAPSDA